MAGEATLQAYEPTWRDRLAQLLLGDERASPEKRRVVEGLLGSSGLGATGASVSDFTPLGMMLSGNELDRAGKEGDAMGVLTSAMAFVPGAKSPATMGKAAFQELMAKTAEQTATRRAQAQALADAGKPVRMQNSNGLSALVSPDMSREVGWRKTVLDKDGPMSHVEYDSPYDAIYNALRDGFLPQAPKEAAPKGIRAYHGSPHDFDAFDLSKIGTGEGAQAYGHGLYLAENEGVAKAYKEAGPAGRAAYDEINSRMSDLAKVMDADKIPGSYRQFRSDKGREAAAEYDALMDKRAKGFGKMYEVNIKADPEHFLDWDKPLSEQGDAVKQALQGFGIKTDPQRVWNVTETAGGKFTVRNHWGEPVGTFKTREAAEAKAAAGTSQADAYGGASVYSQLGGNTAYPYLDKGTASQALREAGIPGIKYLDQGSRAAGDGSRNYVVFDPATIEIIRKYGLAGLTALGGLGGLGGMPGSNQAEFAQ